MEQHTYEGMFLFDSGFANDFAKVEAEIQRLMDRAQAQIIRCGKWDERKLAYDIKGRKRGCYVLVFFKAPAEKIITMQRDVNLSESVLRALILRADYLTEEQMEKAYIARGQALTETVLPTDRSQDRDHQAEDEDEETAEDSSDSSENDEEQIPESDEESPADEAETLLADDEEQPEATSTFASEDPDRSAS